ncbi:uncharacterized protein LOC117652963 [Thrips palmi]|uniref:Uncharacterized protein LOC117652963 n=1 Tax=Thrips palmi TaxID=161013 RepID=A0A6P9A809_THRPL|nr:uncharacterized protein LOC117652963 [Thrips palmi]
MLRFTNNERMDILTVYRESGNRIAPAQRLYRQRYPGRIVPSAGVFRRVEVNLQVHGQFVAPRAVHRPVGGDPALHAIVRQHIDQNPHAGQRGIGRAVGISHRTAGRILKTLHLHPFKVHLNQELHGNDFANRIEFCHWMQGRLAVRPDFQEEILWTDESCFTSEGEVNRHNCHFYAVENPHWVRPDHVQGGWSINCWAGILGRRLIGPYFFDGPPLNGPRYLQFLQQSLVGLLHEAEVPLNAVANHWLMQDGAPPHWARAVRAHLNEVYPDRWIGRGGPVAWPARSPDLTPLDFFLWGYVKARVYDTRPENRDELKARIEAVFATVDEDMLGRVHQCGMRRYAQCIERGGQTFEHIFYE